MIIDPANTPRCIEHELDGCASRIWQKDAQDFLASLPASSVDQIVTSPPYFIGKEYDSSKSVEAFRKEIARILPSMIRALKPGGSLCWQVGNHVADGLLVPLDAIIVAVAAKRKQLRLRNRIIWTFDHGVHAQRRFSGRHETILWYTKGDWGYFDLDSVRVPQKYPGKRHYKGPKKGQWSGNPLGKNPGDVWDIGDVWGIPNVKANHIEKTGHPCQFPSSLVRRLIVALSPRGGLIADPYAGSATTAVASLLEGRSFIGSDLESNYLDIANKRLSALQHGLLSVRDDVPVYVPAGNEQVAVRPAHFLKHEGEATYGNNESRCQCGKAVVHIAAH